MIAGYDKMLQKFAANDSKVTTEKPNLQAFMYISHSY